MLDHCLAAPLEGRCVTVLREACGAPEAHWRLRAQLALEGAQRGARAQRPVAPRAAREAVLVEHPLK
eukprot:5558289-Pyramimonas_sp.AAC.1